MTVRGDLGQKAVDCLQQIDTANSSGIARTASDLKVSQLGAKELKGSNRKLTGTLSQLKLSINAPAIKGLIKGIAQAILTKLKLEPKMALNQPQNGHLNKADAQKQTFLKSFGDTVIQPLAISKDQNVALKSTVKHLEQAQKSGMLDQKLYSAVSSTLDRNIKVNVRREISLDDDAASEKTIHDLVLEVPTTSKTLRTELEKLAQVEKCIAKFTSALENHANIRPEQAREIVRKAFEAYPKSNLVTVHNVTVMLETANVNNPDVIVEGKYLASGAASKVHHKGFRCAITNKWC